MRKIFAASLIAAIALGLKIQTAAVTHQSECVKPTNCPTFDSLADTIIVGITEGQDGNVTKHPNSAPDENIAEAKVCPRNNPNSFAETEAELVTHTCVTAQTRMKKALPDFYNLYAEKTATKYSDPDFLPDQDSIFWAVMNEGILSWADMDEGILRGIDWEQKNSLVQWQRAQTVWPTYTLFGSKGVDQKDIKQSREINNSWFMAACHALAKVPSRVENLFLNLENKISPNGIYGVNIYLLGVPTTIIIDDYLPLQSGATAGTYETLFAGIGAENALWVPLLEKAFAKLYGNYAHIYSGQNDDEYHKRDPRMAVNTLIGAPHEEIVHGAEELALGAPGRFTTENERLNFLWNKIQDNHKKGAIIMSGTRNKYNQFYASIGIVRDQVYSVLDLKLLSTGQRLIRLFNPQSSDQFTGNWSDSSILWTSKLKDEVNFVAADDGMFWMSFEEYWYIFSETYISFDSSKWYRDYFMKLNDQSEPIKRGAATATQREEKVTSHTLSITSSVQQYVYITAHTWDDRCMVDQCKSFRGAHRFYFDGTRRTPPFFYQGSFQLGPILMKKDQRINLTVEWDFSERKEYSFANQLKDWSVVAYGLDGQVTVKHPTWNKSDQFPYIPRKYSKPTPKPTPTPTPTATEQQKFVDWADSYPLKPATSTTCHDIMEQEHHKSGHRVIFKTNCTWLNYTFTVWMLSTDWAKIQYFYQKKDSTGKITANTILTNCGGRKRTDKPTWTACDLTIGKIPATTTTEASYQFIGGWTNGIGLAGVQYYEKQVNYKV